MESNAILALAAILVFAAAILGIRFNFYTVFLELLAGFALGNLLGFTLPDQIGFLAHIGLIALMFMAGMEIDFTTFKEKWRKSVSLGVGSYVIPFAAIGGALFFVFGRDLDKALIAAIALVPASAGVAYTLLVQKGPLGTRRKMILSSIMVTDILSMVLLGVFFSRLSFFTIGLFAFVVASFWFLPKLGKWIGSIGGKDIVNIEIKFALAVILVSEFFAGLAGVDAVLIAFLFGMAFSEIFSGTSESNKLAEDKLQAIVFGFLTPIFFFATGYGISGAVFVDFWYIILGLVLFTFVVKWGTVYLIGRSIFPERIKSVAMLFNTPLSIGIVTVGIGREQGVLTDEIASILLLVIIIISFVGVLFTKYPELTKEESL